MPEAVKEAIKVIREHYFLSTPATNRAMTRLFHSTILAVQSATIFELISIIEDKNCDLESIQ